MKPVWPESGGIPPQHRQFPDAYAEDLVAMSFGMTHPEGWGVAELEVEREATGVRITKLQARFPSGTCILLAQGESLHRQVSLSPTGVLLSVGLAKSSPSAPNVIDVPIGEAVRHVREHGHLRANLRLLVDDEGGGAYERLPVARITQDGFDDSFLPPLLRTPPGSWLAGALQAVRAALGARQAELLISRAARPLDLATLASTQVPQLLVLSALQEAMALLGSTPPPCVTHSVLAELLGTLDTIGGGGTPLPSYAHEAPGASFRALTSRLLRRIPTVARDPHRAFQLERRDPSTFALTLQEPDLFDRKVYLVASGADERTLAARLPLYAKVASAAWLPSLVQQAIQGVAIATEFDAPPSLPSGDGHCCFRVDTRSAMWRDVVDQRSLMVHVPDAPRELALTAYVFPPSAPLDEVA